MSGQSAGAFPAVLRDVTVTGRPAAVRLPSVDLLRGLDVFLMLFVNEMSGVRGTPRFLLHTPSAVDGMTITDVVFPAFLFITGMSLPLAIDARLARGESAWHLWRHTLTRTFALLVMGVFMVNGEEATAGWLSPAAWNAIMTVALMLIWVRPAATRDSRGKVVRVAAGALLLAGLALAYHSDEGSGLAVFSPHWWGILGLIGWAYLVGATIYLSGARSSGALLAAAALLCCFCFADQAGDIGWLIALRPYISTGSVFGSHAALVVFGAALIVRVRRSGERAPRQMLRTGVLVAAALALAAWLLHSLHEVDDAFWYNKVIATVPWILMSAAITAAAWSAIVGLTEGLGWTRWPQSVRTAGEHALLIYMLAPLLLSLVAIAADVTGGINPYEALAPNLLAGTIRSAVFAWLVVRLAGWLASRGLRLRV